MIGRPNVTSETRPSPTLWGTCPLEEIILYNGGIHAFDDFAPYKLLTSFYTATQATTGTFLHTDAFGGVALVDCDSTTSTQGINVQASSTLGEFIKPAAGKPIWFETRIKAADIATGPEFFVGLSVIDTTIIGSSALSAQAIGFKSLTDDNVILATCKDGSSETTASSIHTFVDDAWVKLGFRVTDASLVELYVNGVRCANTITANIPTTELTFSIVCQSAGTTDPIIHLDWWKLAQLR